MQLFKKYDVQEYLGTKKYPYSAFNFFLSDAFIWGGQKYKH